MVLYHIQWYTLLSNWCVPYVKPARKERKRARLEQFCCGFPANFSNMSYKIWLCLCVCDKFNRFILAMEFRLQCTNWKRGNKKNERHDKDKDKQFHIESDNTFPYISYEANMVFPSACTLVPFRYLSFSCYSAHTCRTIRGIFHLENSVNDVYKTYSWFGSIRRLTHWKRFTIALMSIISRAYVLV